MSTLKEFPIADYRRTYGLEALIETGTYRGRSALHAIDVGYPYVATCDLTRDWLDASLVSRGDRPPELEFFLGVSTDCLPTMLDRVATMPAVLFWFDAHIDPYWFDGRIMVSPDPLPLPRELDCLLARRDVRRDVILIDDLPLYCANRWRQDNPGIPSDARPIYPTAEAIVDRFPNHDAVMVNPSDYALILTPKGR